MSLSRLWIMSPFSFFLSVFFPSKLESSPKKFLFHYLSGHKSDLHCDDLALWKKYFVNFTSFVLKKIIKANRSVWVKGASSSWQVRILCSFWNADSNVFFLSQGWARINLFLRSQNVNSPQEIIPAVSLLQDLVYWLGWQWKSSRCQGLRQTDQDGRCRDKPESFGCKLFTIFTLKFLLERLLPFTGSQRR